MESQPWHLQHQQFSTFFPWFLEKRHDMLLFSSYLFTLNIHILLRVYVKQFLQAKVLR